MAIESFWAFTDDCTGSVRAVSCVGKVSATAEDASCRVRAVSTVAKLSGATEDAGAIINQLYNTDKHFLPIDLVLYGQDKVFLYSDIKLSRDTGRKTIYSDVEVTDGQIKKIALPSHITITDGSVNVMMKTDIRIIKEMPVFTVSIGMKTSAVVERL